MATLTATSENAERRESFRTTTQLRLKWCLLSEPLPHAQLSQHFALPTGGLGLQEASVLLDALRGQIEEIEDRATARAFSLVERTLSALAEPSAPNWEAPPTEINLSLDGMSFVVPPLAPATVLDQIQVNSWLGVCFELGSDRWVVANLAIAWRGEVDGQCLVGGRFRNLSRDDGKRISRFVLLADR